MITICEIMNTIQLNKILEIDKFSKKVFIGTFPIDLLPEKIKYPCCMIINNQPSKEAGEHWIAVYFNKNRTCDFFDSFANSPKFYKLHNYMKRFCKGINFNKKKIQSNRSLYCGIYCVLFILFKSRGYSMKKFTNFFKNPISNDKSIRKLIKKN